MPLGKKYGGRQKGTPNKTTKVIREAAAKATIAGIMPLEYMLAVMRDTKANQGRRDEMAKAAAPYIHAKLATLQSNVNLTGRLTLEALVNESIKASLPANDDEAMKLIEGEAVEEMPIKGDKSSE